MAPGGLKGWPFMFRGNHCSETLTQSAMRAPPGQATGARCGSMDQS